MLLLVECTMYQEIKGSIFTVSKIGFSIFILIYFGANLVSCEENIPYYLRSMKKLEDDVKEWQGNCLNDKLHDRNTSCCKAVKEYNQDRRKMQRRLCFFKDIYPEPYIFIRSGSKIKVVDLLTHGETLVVGGLGDSHGLAVDFKNRKVYFGDGNESLSRADFDGSSREVILENAMVRKMAIDWIRQRIFWTKIPEQKRIFVVNMDGKQGRTLTNTTNLAYDIAVDPLAGFLFWTDLRGKRVQGMNLTTHVIVTLASISHKVLSLSLDYASKRLYLISSNDVIFMSGYDGANRKTIKTGSFNTKFLATFEESMYFQEKNFSYINEMNISSGIISRKIKIEKTDHPDLVVFHSSLQPMGQCPIPCGPFGYCNKSNGSCQCEVGFEMKGNTCTDIDECVSSPCGRRPNIVCSNFQGFYKCSCKKGYALEEGDNKCIAYSDLQMKMVKPKNNKPGTIQMYHPSLGWGRVCGYYRWTDREGIVFCRGTKVTENDVSYYGKEGGPTLLDYVYFTGDKAYIWNTLQNKTRPFCGHGDDC